MRTLVTWFAQAADAWAAWMSAMSWQVALAAVAVWAIARLCSRKSAGLRHLLWLLVFLKLALPPLLAAPWSAGTAGRHLTETYLAGKEITVAGFEIRPRQPDETAEAPPAAETDEFAAPAAATSLPRLSWMQGFFVVWAFVAAALFSILLFQYRRFSRRLLAGALPAPESIEAALREEAEAMGIGRHVRIQLSPALSTPAVFGFLRPVVLLPENAADLESGQHLRNILRHELAHVQRRDIPTGWAVAGLLCLYWFHPAVWLANFYLRREMEMACDDKALQEKRHGEQDYAATIVRVAERFRGGVPVGAGFLGLLEMADNLLHRVRAASDGRRKRRTGRGALVGVAIFALLLLPMSAWTPRTAAQADDVNAAREKVEPEIAAHYAKAEPEIQEYIRWTAREFGSSGLWLPADAFAELSPAERKEKAAYYGEALKGEYGRHLCEALAAAGALQDPALIPGLIKVASYHRDGQDYDCRPKWMAVAALGRQDDPAVAHVLIPLVDHGNQNTRMWARASLVRLTGKNFGDDKQAWGKWWNESDKEPKLSEADLAPWTPPTAAEPQAAQSQEVPLVVATVPAKGATDVDPALTELRVTFNVDMNQGGFSWTGGPPLFPEVTEKPKWLDARTCVLPVKLEAAKNFRVGFNSTSHRNFRSAAGIPAQVDALYFATRGWEGGSLDAPKAVKMAPENGMAGVSPALTELKVTFDQPMGGGFSWVTLDESTFPEMSGKPEWSEDKKTCTASVKLEPSKTYRFGLNHARYKNFNSANGIALEPIMWEFTTGAAQ